MKRVKATSLAAGPLERGISLVIFIEVSTSTHVDGEQGSMPFLFENSKDVFTRALDPCQSTISRGGNYICSATLLSHLHE